MSTDTRPGGYASADCDTRILTLDAYGLVYTSDCLRDCFTEDKGSRENYSSHAVAFLS
ncbi:hypothetical protein [secondary endosymbiont of Ctenarytaina eucalypti]|uniref:hypothetical protein n=1 Tax=secondary endosymbiont of Ctenarytaina eucalypti TaxID=1199245 RepID=UPI0002EEAFAD|nr:hypothetical protein [secondary endosymbiont of Ctenarytaina eucalypti]